MKKFLIQIFIISLFYLIFTIIVSLIVGLPPFNTGMVIGYPAIYYQFYLNENEIQFGFTNVVSVFLNFIIVISIYVFYNLSRSFFNKKAS
ncbi:hypothetical protein J2X31_003285 [Flavobacterium arsenatis]|uniref:Uncharacterized protein n=1 Tax=Flavobacterium arsenatis TaxID=1484332 RepID=A0ABU1TTR0_9FLAO|nr:hypothetical protein [Flavobacterium arsenatis]